MDELGEDGLGGLLLGEVGVEVVEVGVVGVHQVDAGGVVDFVAALLRPLLVQDLVGLDAELLHALLQLDVVPRNASHSDDVLAELRQVLLHHLRSVALGVDRNEHKFEFHVGAFWQVPDDAINRREVVERARTDVRAIRVPEVDEVVVALQISAGERLAFDVEKRPISSDQRFLLLEFLQAGDVVLYIVEILAALLVGVVEHIK